MTCDMAIITLFQVLALYFWWIYIHIHTTKLTMNPSSSHSSAVIHEESRHGLDIGMKSSIQATLNSQEESEHKRFSQENQKSLLADRMKEMKSLLQHLKETDWMFEKNTNYGIFSNTSFVGEFKKESVYPRHMNSIGSQERHFSWRQELLYWSMDRLVYCIICMVEWNHIVLYHITKYISYIHTSAMRNKIGMTTKCSRNVNAWCVRLWCL